VPAAEQIVIPRGQPAELLPRDWRLIDQQAQVGGRRLCAAHPSSHIDMCTVVTRADGKMQCLAMQQLACIMLV
jgi:hypothetical protein